MLQPKKTKYRKPFRISHLGKTNRGITLAFGDYGLQAVTSNWITNRQIEATRIAITRSLSREGDVYIRIFPHLSKTSKPIGVRMGKGKGNPSQWVAVVKKNIVMFEVKGVSKELAFEALRLGMHKLPIKCRIIAKESK